MRDAHLKRKDGSRPFLLPLVRCARIAGRILAGLATFAKTRQKWYSMGIGMRLSALWNDPVIRFACALCGGALVLALALGFPFTLVWIVGFVVGAICVWRFPYAGVIALALASLFPGLMISIPVQEFELGERLFQGVIEPTYAEALLVVMCLGWALRIFTARPEDRLSASPRMPLIGAFAVVLFTHVISVFSAAHPEVTLVVKYSLRSIVLTYALAIFIPTNFFRTWKRLDQFIAWIVAVALPFALEGLVSLIARIPDALGILRAHPFIMWHGRSPLGGNHHALAELLLLAAPLSLYLGLRQQEGRMRGWLYGAAGLYWLVALLTFARAAWLVVALQLACIGWFGFRKDVIRIAREVGVWFAVPVALLTAYMAWFSLGYEVASSTSARTELASIAWYFFREHPLVGVGAGRFVEHLGSIRAFVVEFGDPLDAHGMIQKIAAETGIIGLGGMGYLLWKIGARIRTVLVRTRHGLVQHEWSAVLVAAVVGTGAYQLFSTSLWQPRSWIALGILLAFFQLIDGGASAHDPDFLKT